MPDDVHIECNECTEEFTKEDTIFECNECNERFHENCWDEHNCKSDDFDTHEPEGCSECDSTQGELYECQDCTEIICESCWEEHSKGHLSKEEYSFEEYVEEKIKDSL